MAINRRTLLRGTAVSLALPFMESMTPAFSKQATPPRRSVFICTALGLHPGSLWPETTGSKYESTVYMDLLKEQRDEITLFSGLSHSNQVGRQAHDSEITWLTSTPKPGDSGFRNGISVDQVMANHIGYTTRFPSLTLASGTSKSQTYTAGGVMVPAQYEPSEIFANLFLEGKPEEVKTQKRRLSEGRSILDQLKGETSRLRRKVSAADNHLLNDYLDSVRQTEINISERESWIDRPKPKVVSEQPGFIDHQDLFAKLNALTDLVRLILQTDSSRVVSLFVQADHQPRIPGVEESHHILSHHGQDEKKIDQLRIIEKGIVSQFGKLVGGLKTIEESGARLLDNTSIVFGSNLGNANSHDARNLPIMLAGGGFKHGSYIAHDANDNTELSDLFLTVLHRQGITLDSFGQSNGLLSW